ncbi:MAG: thiamine phosphate synthase [Campylobacter sp.]|nr:thiamine phosphate synthase [Campylobacter sp.]
MYKIIFIANLSDNKERLKSQIHSFCKAKIDAVVLRAKALSEAEYKELFLETKKICDGFSVKLYLHNFYKIALELKYPFIWLPLPKLTNFVKVGGNLAPFKEIVASTHSVDEAKFALNLGANTLSISHIFPTSCKSFATPKGIGLIKDVREFFSGEIYALGGIDEKNYCEVLQSGANAICMMSLLERCGSKILNKFER